MIQRRERVRVKPISSLLMLWQTVHIVVAGIHETGFTGKDETPVTGAKSNTKNREGSLVKLTTLSL